MRQDSIDLDISCPPPPARRFHSLASPPPQYIQQQPMLLRCVTKAIEPDINTLCLGSHDQIVFGMKPSEKTGHGLSQEEPCLANMTAMRTYPDRYVGMSALQISSASMCVYHRPCLHIGTIGISIPQVLII